MHRVPTLLLLRLQDKYQAMAEIQRTITRRLSRLPSRFPTLDLDDAQQVLHAALHVVTHVAPNEFTMHDWLPS